MTATSRTKYDTIAMALHWIIAALMIFLIFFGEDLMEEAEDGGEAMAGTFLPSLHVSLGSAVLVLSVLRLLWRTMNPPPALPATMAPWEVLATKVTHGVFYVLMIGLPLTGWLSFPRFLRENPAMSEVSIFGVIGVPGAPDPGIPAGLLHNVGSKVGMALVILHVLAALKHQFVSRDGLLGRMSPH